MSDPIPPQLLGSVVERLRALADENRIRILLRLKAGECNVSTLAEELGLAQASVSKHLAVLRQVGLVDVRREGTLAFYSIRDRSVFEMCEIVCGGVVRHLQAQQQALADNLGNRSRPRARRSRTSKTSSYSRGTARVPIGP